MALLDAATLLAAPDALAFQLRSNVAYLMGDRKAARDALKQGLSLDPSNAVLRANLQRLEGEM